jgi:hypothetical protein
VLRSLAIGVGVFALTLLAGHAAPWVRRLWRERAGRSSRGAIYRHIQLADRALARAGLARHPSTPMRAHAAAIRRAHRDGAHAYDQLARMHYEQRFGSASVAEESRAAELLDRLRRALRENDA